MSRNRGVAIGKLGVDALRLRRCSILMPCSSVPVRKHVAPLQAPEARERVRRHGLIGMADMGRVVRIGDGRGDDGRAACPP